MLNGPLAVALDSSGNLLYIADTGNNVIRKIVLSTGVITTVAGTLSSAPPRSAVTKAAMAGWRRALQLNKSAVRGGGLLREPLHRRYSKHCDP